MHEAVISSATAQAEAATLRDQLHKAERAAKSTQEKLDAELLRRQHAESKVCISLQVPGSLGMTGRHDSGAACMRPEEDEEEVEVV